MRYRKAKRNFEIFTFGVGLAPAETKPNSKKDNKKSIQVVGLPAITTTDTSVVIPTTNEPLVKKKSRRRGKKKKQPEAN